MKISDRHKSTVSSRLRRSHITGLKLALVIVSITLFTGAVATSPDASTLAMADSQKSGAAIYAEHCASCHGADGRAKTKRGRRKGATDLTKSRISVRSGLRIITRGKDRMPDFGEDLSAAEIRRVNSYVRRFRN